MKAETYKQAESIRREIEQINTVLEDLELARSVGFDRRTTRAEPVYMYTKFYNDEEVKQAVIAFYKARIAELERQFEAL